VPSSSCCVSTAELEQIFRRGNVELRRNFGRGDFNLAQRQDERSAAGTEIFEYTINSLKLKFAK
jgi:hypothetical protein